MSFGSTALLGIWTAQAHTIDLGPATRECYFEDLHGEDKVNQKLRRLFMQCFHLLMLGYR